MRKQGAALVLALSMLVATGVEASGEVGVGKDNTVQNICGVIIKETDYKDAMYLDGAGRYEVNNEYVQKIGEAIATPKLSAIADAVNDILNIYHNEGVDIDEIVKDVLEYEVINIQLPGVQATAYVRHTDPKIYMYGSYTKPILEMDTYLTTYHEFGHFIEQQHLSVTDFEEYKEIRGIPKDWQQWRGTPWVRDSAEIFAEDVAQIMVEYMGTQDTRKEQYRNLRFDNWTEMGNLTESEKEKILNLVLRSLKGSIAKNETTKYADDKLYTFVQQNKEMLHLTDVKCKTEVDTYYGKELPAVDLSNWLMTYKKNQKVTRPLEVVSYVEEGTTGNKKVDAEEFGKRIKLDKETLDTEIAKLKRGYWDAYVKGNTVKDFKGKELNEAYTVLEKLGVLDKEDLNPNNQGDPIKVQEAMLWVYNIIGMDKQELRKIRGDEVFVDIPDGSGLARPAVLMSELGIFNGDSAHRIGWNKTLTQERMKTALGQTYGYEVEGKQVKTGVTKEQFALHLSEAYLTSKNGEVPGSNKNEYDAVYNLIGTLEGVNGGVDGVWKMKNYVELISKTGK